MTNLEIGLLISTGLFFILYIVEKMKPKTAEEIQYQREKDEIDRLRLKQEYENLKTLDEEIKALEKPVVFIAANGRNEDFPEGVIFRDYAYNEINLSVRDNTGTAKSFQINGKWGHVRKEAPFIASLLETKIFNNQAKEKEKDYILF